MKTLIILSQLFFSLCFAEEITPFKFTDSLPAYEIPASSRFTVKEQDAEIIYYFSAPKVNEYPIAILCGGSSSEQDISSIIHFHRYFLQEFLDLNIGLITIEQRGVDGSQINATEFMTYYTRSNRLADHKTVIEYLNANPPQGWNGRYVFVGVSEGGPIVTSLTTQYAKSTQATINWSGAGAYPWRDELWEFLVKMMVDNPACVKGISTRGDYDEIMDAIALNPIHEQCFLGMTHHYHADAMLYPLPDYQKIRTPYLVVTGAKDTLITSSDAFVYEAKNAGVPITYLRVEDMDHYVRKRPDILSQSFEWLKSKLTSYSYPIGGTHDPFR